ncbi:MAG: dolichyl-diphosphooligosaccharide--protein glycosyltransferase subunit STT3 [Desulfovibrio sp.]|nr:dolichyl-diphosphooligosaccharide--protein glycosyltransferase subunit STT3 [Desulfovibrio sp.]
MKDAASSLPFFGRRGLCMALLTFFLALGLRMLEWPSWQDAEFRLGSQWLLATHDAYHWLAGAEGFGLATGHPMAVMLKGLADLLQMSPANVAFWFPMYLSSLVAVIVFAWAWALGSLEAGIAAGLLTAFSPGFLARTLLGFYDTDLITLFFPLLMTLVPASWAMRYLLLPKTVLNILLKQTAYKTKVLSEPLPQGNPLHPSWVLLLGLSGLISWWTQSWHSVFPYLIRYNVVLLACLALLMAPKRRRGLVLLGALAYALPSLAGPWALSFSLLLIAAHGQYGRTLLHLLSKKSVLFLFWLGTLYLLAGGDIAQTIINHVNSYLKHTADVKNSGANLELLYPSVAQSIVEVQDLNVASLLSYFHPWPEAAILGLVGFVVVLVKRPGALFLLPLALLALASLRLGGRMVMFGAPIIALGLSLPLYWLLQRIVRERLRGMWAGLLTSTLLIITLVLPFTEIIAALSQGPMINRRHADCLTQAQAMTPENAMLWLWWDWGYAAHHFARRATIADGAQHAGPSLYLPAAVFATDNPRFARQLMRYTENCGNVAGNVFCDLDGHAAQQLMDRLRSPETALIPGKGRIFIVVSFEMLRLGFWISNFGSWNFVTHKGEGGALSIIPHELSFRLDTGEVRLSENDKAIDAASISIFQETGITHRDYVQEWVNAHPNATEEEKGLFLNKRRNVHFLFNKVTDEKLAIDERLANSLMVRLLLTNGHDPKLSPYFKLVYDNVFARIYEVL